jgi:predicted NodU family carbamoyl transferase
MRVHAWYAFASGFSDERCVCVLVWQGEGGYYLTMLEAAVEHIKGFYIDGEGALRRTSRRIGDDFPS